jgi:hypothetical protein
VATSSPTRRLAGAAAWPVLARAQQPAVPVIGFLGSQSADDSKNFLVHDSKNFLVPFLQGLRETGYVQNVAVEGVPEGEGDDTPCPTPQRRPRACRGRPCATSWFWNNICYISVCYERYLI